MTNAHQPEAMRLAASLELCWGDSRLDEAAAELRRLHAENEDYGSTIDHLTRENAGQIGEIVALKEQRDELLEACKALTQIKNIDIAATGPLKAAVEKAAAAIAKVGGAA